MLVLAVVLLLFLLIDNVIGTAHLGVVQQMGLEKEEEKERITILPAVLLEEEEEILLIQERKKKAGGMGDNVITTRLQFSIVAIEGKTDKSLIGSFIRSMPARDSLHLRNHIDKHEPGIDMTSHMDCPSCSEVSEVRIPLGVTFFWPNAG